MRIRNNYSGSGKKIRVRPDPDHHPCSKLPMLLQIFCYSDKKGSDPELKHYFRTLEPECFSSGSSSLLIWIRMTGTSTLCAFSRNKIFIIVILQDDLEEDSEDFDDLGLSFEIDDLPETQVYYIVCSVLGKKRFVYSFFLKQTLKTHRSSVLFNKS